VCTKCRHFLLSTLPTTASLIPFASHPAFPYDWETEHGDALREADAHAYSVDSRDWQALLGSIGGREAHVMVEAKGKEQALAPMGVEIV
jgi:hypothetical protein